MLLNEPAPGLALLRCRSRPRGGERRDPGGWRGRGRRGARRAARRSRCCAAASCRAAPSRPSRSRPGGSRHLGARLVAARRTRLARHRHHAGLSTAFVLLMLALASALETLETDPGGARQALPADRTRCRRRRPPAVAPDPRASRPWRRATRSRPLDSFSLGETIDVIAYPGDGRRRSRRRRSSPDTGSAGPARPRSAPGWPQALGLDPGATLAIAAASRATSSACRVAGVVSSLDHDGRVAYVPAAALLAGDPIARRRGARGAAAAPVPIGGHRRSATRSGRAADGRDGRDRAAGSRSSTRCARSSGRSRSSTASSACTR